MKIPTLRGEVEIPEPTPWQLSDILRNGTVPDEFEHPELMRVYMAGAQAMRDALESGHGARLEAALMGVHKNR